MAVDNTNPSIIGVTVNGETGTFPLLKEAQQWMTIDPDSLWLKHLMKLSEANISAHLFNGVRLTGKLLDFDRCSVLIQRSADSHPQLVLRPSISTIQACE